MKITGKQIRALVKETVRRRLEENIVSDLIPGADGQLADYYGKVSKFLDKTIDDAEQLADEGEKLMRVDVKQHALVGERNRLILIAIGFLRKLRFNLASQSLDLRKLFG